MDLIERQAAIDAVYDAFSYAYCDNCEKELDEDLCGDCHRKYQNWSASKKTVEKVINALPSAQPETHEERTETHACDLISRQADIIHCRDCKHYYYADNRIPQEQRFVCALDDERWKPDDFCSYAERREDE